MADTKTKVEILPRIEPKVDLKEPSNYNVIYINDESTTMEFVVESLKIVFNYAQESAEALTYRVHEEGSAVVATLPYEIAEQKGVEATLLARNHGFPLQIKIEQEQ
jgi:ATP-dependent Clp protease adaptor protein ClpS